MKKGLKTASDKKAPRRRFTFIDLFAGCGGLTEGFLQSGKYEAFAHVEWEKPMIETLRHRLVKACGYSEAKAKRDVIHFDIQRTDELINGAWSQESVAKYGATNFFVFENVTGILSADATEKITINQKQ